jgi:L-aspartate oxidase
MIETDVLVIGSGIAGGITALKCAQEGANVVLLHRGTDPEQTNTRWAQGGVIYTGPGDSPELLAADIEAAGAGLSYPPAAELLALEGPRLVRRILMDELGVPFDRGPDGELDITGEAAHSVPRIAHHKDCTGKAIHDALAHAIAEESRITCLDAWVAVDLLTLAHHSRLPLDIYQPNTCIGAHALNRVSGRVEPILARETVLATGGLGQLYVHTTNPGGARGDGIAMAYRAGARLINLEYVQFHPTALYCPPAPRVLIYE